MGSAGSGRFVVDANEALFIFSCPFMMCMSCSKPVSVISGVYVPGPGVGSLSTRYLPISSLGGIVAELVRRSLRSRVPPNVPFPSLLDFWKDHLAFDERLPISMTLYSPGSPHVSFHSL